MRCEVYENTDDNMTSDEVAALLVKLYAEYYHACGGFETETTKKYYKAIGIAIRMLVD